MSNHVYDYFEYNSEEVILYSCASQIKNIYRVVDTFFKETRHELPQNFNIF